MKSAPVAANAAVAARGGAAPPASSSSSSSSRGFARGQVSAARRCASWCESLRARVRASAKAPRPLPHCLPATGPPLNLAAARRRRYSAFAAAALGLRAGADIFTTFRAAEESSVAHPSAVISYGARWRNVDEAPSAKSAAAAAMMSPRSVWHKSRVPQGATSYVANSCRVGGSSRTRGPLSPSAKTGPNGAPKSGYAEGRRSGAGERPSAEPLPSGARFCGTEGNGPVAADC